MKKILLALSLILLSLSAGAQTIIPLEKGHGGVRAKNVDDYKDETQTRLREAEDSLEYVDHLRRAFNALHTDSLAKAESLFHDALKLRPSAPGNQVIRYNLGLIDMARGSNAEAVKKLTTIIKEYPLYFDARLARAEANLQLGRASEVVDDAQQVLEKQGYEGVTADVLERARFLRAAARYQLRLFPDAHADLQTIIGDNPKNVNAQILDALTLQQMGQPKEALNRLNLIVASQPDNIDALSTRASVEYELEMYGMARADYDTLIERQPSESSYRVERAKALIRLGEKQAAKADLDEAVRLGIPNGMVHPLYQQVR